MAQFTKTQLAKLTSDAHKPAPRPKTAAAPVTPAASSPAHTKAPRVATAPATAKTPPARATVAAPVAAVAARVPRPSKGELRAQIEKLEAANAALRAKNREANRVAKMAARRVAELEADVAHLHEAATKAVTPTEPAPPAKTPRPPATRRRKEIDPGDAVPPGVAVQEPEPLDAEATAARDALEEHLSGE